MRNLFCNDRVAKMFKSFSLAEDFSPLVGEAIAIDTGIEADESLVFSVTKRIKNAMMDPELFSNYRRNILISTSAQEFGREMRMSCVLDEMFKRESEGYRPLPDVEAFENNGLRMLLQFFGNRCLDGGGFVRPLDEDKKYTYKERREEIDNQTVYSVTDSRNITKDISPKVVLNTILRMMKDGRIQMGLHGEDYHQFINCIANNMRNEQIASIISSRNNQFHM